MLPIWFQAIIAFAFGSCIGSFLNVVIYRLPLGLSVVSPASSCPACKTPIRPFHNIPVIGYLVLRGRCAACGVRISARYPLVEALTGALWAGLWLKCGPGAQFAAHLVLVTGLVAVTFIDIDHKIIPDRFSLGGIAVGFAFSFFTDTGVRDSLLGILAGGGSLWAVAEGYTLVTKKEGMGFGDVKLLAAIGAFLGWKAILFTILAASLTGSVVGIIAMKLSNADRHLEVPFGPFLSFGAALYIYYGPELVEIYLSTLA